MKRHLLNWRYIVCCVLTLLLAVCIACREEQKRTVTADFSYTVVNDNYEVPVTLKIENKSTHADYFQWTFEGGEPSTSKNKQPEDVYYAAAGTYTIKLKVWNLDEQQETSQTVCLDSAMTVDFNVVLMDSDTVPTTVRAVNKSRGASSYTWSFAGATPTAQEGLNPAVVCYKDGGSYDIILTAANGRISKTATRTVDLKPAVAAQFEIIPTHESYDYQIPFTAALKSLSVSAGHVSWSCQNAVITDGGGDDAQLFIDVPGTYTVTLDAHNSKASQSVSQQLIIAPNSNLHHFRDLKFGIARATAVGQAFSAARHEVVFIQNLTYGADIDIVFYGLNASFGLCRFISPDQAGLYGLGAIVPAEQTTIMNKPAQAESPALTIENFEAMHDDSVLQALDIVFDGNETAFFTKNEGQRIVLFETHDGRRGAIHVRAFIDDGDNSYVLCDVKIQKSHNEKYNNKLFRK